MAAEPPVATRNQPFSSESFSMNGNDFRSSHNASSSHLSTSFSGGVGGGAMDATRRRVLDGAPMQFSTMINEIERVRSRFASEKSSSDQFSSQLRMLSQQIESLTGQQSSMLEFHIGRMDSMLKDLKSSGDAISKEQQRASFESEQRAKFEREERERRDKLERERVESEQRAKFEQEQRQRMEREMMEKLEREQREREHKDKMQSLQQGSLPAMNLSDIIPQPSRTVTVSKRKLSLDLGNSRSASSQQADSMHNKRAKVDTSDGAGDFNALYKQFMNKGAAEEKQTAVGETPSSADDGSIPMEDSDLPADNAQVSPADTDMDSSPSTTDGLPSDIQEALKQQAMAMLQAQLEHDTSAPTSHMDLPPMDDDISPSSGQTSNVVKSEPSAMPPQSSSSLPPSVIKPEKSVPPRAAVKPEPKAASKKSASKKAKKEVVPAVEDTTIADPMSVPLKNKAIHEWMSKDPERLYTADDICKAGIRYRASRSIASKSISNGRVYVLDNLREIQLTLSDKRTKGVLWQNTGVRGSARWKIIS